MRRRGRADQSVGVGDWARPRPSAARWGVCPAWFSAGWRESVRRAQVAGDGRGEGVLPERAGDVRRRRQRRWGGRIRSSRAWPRSRTGRPAQPPQLGQHLAQRLALDVLHHVVVSVALAANAEDGHDVGVVQPPRGPRLALEPSNLHRGGQGMWRQDLQGHAAAE